MTNDNDFENYQIDDRECRAFHFSPDGRWCQSFVIIWTPGYINVVGDMGHLIIQHYCMTTFENAIGWLSTALNTPNYFMEKVVNYKPDIFDAEATKKYLIDYIKDFNEDEVKEYIQNYLDFDFIDEKLFDCDLNNDFTIFQTETGITGEDIAKKLKDYDLTEEDLKYINDFELPVFTYDWGFLNCRIEALKEFCKKVRAEFIITDNEVPF